MNEEIKAALDALEAAMAKAKIAEAGWETEACYFRVYRCNKNKKKELERFNRRQFGLKEKP